VAIISAVVLVTRSATTRNGGRKTSSLIYSTNDTD
jgi:hypothetical protein